MKTFKVNDLVKMHPDYCPKGWDRERIGVILTPPAPFMHTVQWGEDERQNYAHHLIPYAPTPPRRFVSEREFLPVPEQANYGDLVVSLKARLYRTVG